MEWVYSIFRFLNEQLLRMEWLFKSVEALVEGPLGLSMAEPLGNSVHFFLYDVIKIILLLSVLVFLLSYVQSYFPPERTRVLLGGIKGIKGNLLGALLGTLTPFCSCSSIPIFIGFTSSGLSLGTTFSFLISSPMVDLASFLLLTSFFGFRVAAIYVVMGLILAVAGGTIIEKLHMEDQVAIFALSANNMEMEPEVLTRKDRMILSKDATWDVFRKVWLYILIGVGVGAMIHNYIPQSAIEGLLGQDNPFAVLVATFVGIPVYADIFGTIPIAEALLLKGVGIGTILSFMMAVTALSLPSLIMLSKVIKPRLLALFITIMAIGILLIGYLFNAFSFLLI